MKQHIVKFTEMGDANDIKERTFVTASEETCFGTYKKGSDRLINILLTGRHSTLNAARYKIKAWVTDRTHDHTVRHDQVNNYYACSTSRLEIPHGKVHVDSDGQEFRLIEFEVDLKRFMEISPQRECPSAHDDTIEFWQLIRDEIFERIPEAKLFTARPCVHTGYCTEVNKDCGYVDSLKFAKQRNELLKLTTSLRKRNRK